MKKWGVVLGLLLVMAQAGGLSAKTLEDVLKEKGVITEEDYKEVTKSKPFDYKLGKGVTLTTPDEKYQLTLGGRLQFRYTYTDYEVNSATKSDTSVWEAKRIRLIAQGYAYTKDLTYKLEFDPRQLASSSNTKGLIETYLNYRFIDEVQLRVGQMKTPFSRQEILPDATLQFVDRSIVVEAFKPTYDIGALLHSKLADGLAYLYAGVYGGAGQTSTRSTNNNMFVARAVVNPLGDMPYSESDVEGSVKPLLSIGANYFMNTLNKTANATATTTGLDNTNSNYAAAPSSSSTAALGNGGWLGKFLTNNNTSALVRDKIDVDSFGCDLAFKWMGLSLQGEYLLGQAENQRTKQLLRAHGFYVQTGYMIIPHKLEAAFRYSYFDPNREVSNDNIIETIGALSYYFDKHNLKIQGDIGNIHDQAKGKKVDDMQYRVQVQLIF